MRVPHTEELQFVHAANGNLSDTIRNTAQLGFFVTSITQERTSNLAVVTLRDLSRDLEMVSVDAKAAGNEGLPPDVLGGNGPEPLLLTKPWYIPPGGEVRGKSISSSGAANTVRIALNGYYSDEKPTADQIAEIPLWVGLYKVVAGSGVGVATHRVPTGIRFRAEALTRSVTSTSGTFRLQAKGVGYLSNNALSLAANAGTLGLPFRWGAPLELVPDQLVSADLADTSTAQNTMWLALLGWQRRG